MPDDYFDLGAYSRPTSTTSTQAQTWFDRGLVWSYAFHHEEAIACFRRALALDDGFAMAWWGLAYALGPNYNKPWEFFDERELGDAVSQAHEAVEAAVRHAETPVERALAEALRHRYPAARPPAETSVWNDDYAAAMRAVHRAHPDDLDVAALYADALMNLHPWDLWDLRTGEPVEGAATLEIVEVLERALALPGGDEHPGLLHLHIHLMELSARPEDALTVADRLRGLVPDAGHLQHMPTHLDVLVGDYRRAIASNIDAVRADRRYIERGGRADFYTLYRCHDLHFVVYAAMFAGQRQVALDHADELADTLPEELLRVESPPMADWLEGFVAIKVHVLVRFGMWADLLELPIPDDPLLYANTTAMLRYGRAIAYAVTGRHEEAAAERAAFDAAYAKVPESRTIFNNTCRDILAIAVAMLTGELAYRAGDVETGLASLRKAVELDDDLPYDEPWGWMQPARHAYGALLLEQGRVEEAERVYRADLGLDPSVPRSQHHPGNVWALHGYHECLTRLGKHEVAAVVEQQLAYALAQTDVPVTASCLCRLDVPSDGCGCGGDGCCCG